MLIGRLNLLSVSQFHVNTCAQIRADALGVNKQSIAYRVEQGLVSIGFSLK